MRFIERINDTARMVIAPSSHFKSVKEKFTNSSDQALMGTQTQLQYAHTAMEAAARSLIFCGVTSVVDNALRDQIPPLLLTLIGGLEFLAACQLGPTGYSRKTREKALLQDELSNRSLPRILVTYSGSIKDSFQNSVESFLLRNYHGGVLTREEMVGQVIGADVLSGNVIIQTSQDGYQTIKGRQVIGIL